jgi:8-oxo-dGTP pyrophosphatase MutT (NUDIX family)
MGAGILPVAIGPDNQLYFLFGQEHDTKDWSDFGGGSQGNETPQLTAVREGYEELGGFLGSLTDMQNLIRDHLITKLQSETYTTFLVLVPYDHMLPFYFNENHKFICAKLKNLIGTKGMFEKCSIHWFSAAEMKKKRNKFRPYYRSDVLPLIINILPTLKSQIKA